MFFAGWWMISWRLHLHFWIFLFFGVKFQKVDLHDSIVWVPNVIQPPITVSRMLHLWTKSSQFQQNSSPRELQARRSTVSGKLSLVSGRASPKTIKQKELGSYWCNASSPFISGTEKAPQRTFAPKISPNFRVNFLSGKKKAHKHKSFWPVTPPVTGGSPDREARGQSFMYYPRNPRNINLFVRIPDREDRWPRWPDRVLCAKVLRAFSAPYSGAICLKTLVLLGVVLLRCAESSSPPWMPGNSGGGEGRILAFFFSCLIWGRFSLFLASFWAVPGDFQGSRGLHATYQVVPSSCSGNSSATVRAFLWLWGSFLAPFWRCGNQPHPHKMRKLRPKLRPRRIWTARIQKYCKSVEKRKNSDNMVHELTAILWWWGWFLGWWVKEGSRQRTCATRFRYQKPFLTWERSQKFKVMKFEIFRRGQTCND